jgi:arylsulfatase A-like enzyme
VSQTDILPTLLDLVGATPPAGIDGKSLTGVLLGNSEGPHSVVLSEGGVAKQEGDKLPGAVISPPWIALKQRRGCGSAASGLMDQGMPVCLYNMDEDPNQMSNVASLRPKIARELLERWNGFRAAHGRTGEVRELSPAFIEELQRSGYDFSTGAP